ncbi:hypothetical protein POSPLADRAFT_1100753, partial [Postia placenta MAD-698-R-SB12]
MSTVSEPLVYHTFPFPGLQVASALFHEVYHTKVLPALGKQSHEQKALWETVLESLLAGVLDFLEEAGADKIKIAKAKDAVANTLYSSICDICFSLTAPMMSVDLRCTAYSLLSDSAAGHAANQHKLRSDTVLGGERLGSVMWRTKDYLALESLLTVFAHLLPPAKDATGGRLDGKRAAYIHSVFVSSQPPEAAGAGEKVADLLSRLLTGDWDDAARKIMDVLASANLTFPQPFSVNEIHACGQLQRADGLFVDDKSLIANVVISDTQCETLTVPYPTIHRIEVDREYSGDETTPSRIDICVNAPPLLGKEPAAKSTPENAREHELWTVSFAIQSDRVERFVRTLTARGLGKRLKDMMPPKLSLAKSPTVLEFDSRGMPVKELIYRTNHSSDDLQSVAQGENDSGDIDASIGTTTDPLGPASGVDVEDSNVSRLSASSAQVSILAQKASGSTGAAATDDAGLVSVITTVAPASKSLVAPQAKTRATSIKRTGSQLVRERVFGASDEELSEVSDAGTVLFPGRSESPLQRKNASLGRRTTATKKKAASAVEDVSENEIDVLVLTQPGFITPPAANPKTPHKSLAKELSRATVDQLGNNPDAPTAVDLLAMNSLDEHSKNLPLPAQRPPASKTTGRHRIDKPTLVTDSDLDPRRSSKKAAPVDAPDPGLHRKKQSDSSRSSKKDLSHLGPDITSSVLAISKSSTLAPAANSSASKNVRVSNHDVKPHGVLNTVPEDLDESDHIVNGSSPVPIFGPDRRSVKAGLRKKGQPLATDIKTSSRVTATKRKRGAPANGSLNPDSDPDSFDMKPPVSKRARRADRSSVLPRSAIPSERTESQVLRPRETAATRATKRYRGKKDRSSSPTVAAQQVDYDELPGTVSVQGTSSPLFGKAICRKEKTGAQAKGTLPASSVRMDRMNAGKKNNCVPSAPEDLSDSPPPPNTMQSEDILHIDDDDREREEVDNMLSSDPKMTSTAKHSKALRSSKPAAVVLQAGPVTFYLTLLDYMTDTQSATSKKSNQVPWADLLAPRGASPAVVETDTRGKEAVRRPPVKGAVGTALFHDVDEYEKTSGATDGMQDHWVMDKNERSNSVSTNIIELDVTEAETQKIDTKHSTPKETIDLTKDDSPVKQKPPRSAVKSLQEELDHGFAFSKATKEDFEMSTPYRKPPLPPVHPSSSASKASRAKHTVTFAPEVPEWRSPRKPVDVRMSMDAREDIAPKANKVPGTRLLVLKPTPIKKLPSDTVFMTADSGRTNKYDTKDKAVGVQEIVDVLQDLQEAVMQKIARRFEGVRDDVRAGREAILAEAAADLLELRTERRVHLPRSH